MNITKNFFSPFFWFIFVLSSFGIYFIFHINTYIKKGIDLVGGSYVVLNVIMDDLYYDLLVEIKKKIEKEITLIEFNTTIKNNELIIILQDKNDIFELQKKISDMKLDIEIKIVNDTLILFFSDKMKEDMIENAISININSLRKRLDPFGAGEMLIARQEKNIVLEIPNMYDKAQVKRLIGSTANLQMKVVIDVSDSKEKLEKKYSYLSENVLIISDKSKNGWYVVSRETNITGALLKKAYVGYGSRYGNEPTVVIEFNSVGAKKFKQMTENNLHKRIAIIIDNEVITAPKVDVVIPDGVASIQGRFSVSEAQELVTMLESGAFAAPVYYAQEKIIAPLLGEKTINQGLYACAIGLMLLFIFSLFYYKGAGVLAFIVLLYNLLVTLIGMAFIGATITLSGLAGLILTLGMAIDSSILLFERMKEEVKNGKSFREAMNIAFSDGVTVILDANITHFIVAAVLYYIGVGPLKGFAISMLIGIISTLFTGIILLKGFLKYTIGLKKSDKLSF